MPFGPPQGRHDIIVIGASAGGVEALKELFRGLPAGFRASLFVVLHITPLLPSHLPEILNTANRIPAHHVGEEESIRPGIAYVAPNDRHLILEDSKVLVTTAPKENLHRPAIDPLFRTAAAAYGPRVVGVVLTGSRDDGTAGLWEIKRRGGLTVVQSPEDAIHPQMPQSALANVQVDYCVPVRDIPALLVSICNCEAAL